jgi:diguanylate cyclase (GGDEF)-like protein/PAS domain S-box-containing protein
VHAAAWKWFLVSTFVLSVVYGLLPVELWKEPIYDGLVLSAFVRIWVGVARHRPTQANQWTLVLMAMGCIAVAEWVWFANDVRGINPFPGWADFLDLAGRALLLLVLARLSARGGQLRDRMAVIDSAVVGIAVAALAWTFVFDQYFNRAEIPMLERLASVIYLSFDLCLFVGFVLLALDARRSTTAMRLLTAGIGVLVVGDAVWLTLLAHGSYTFGQLSDALWPIAYCTIAAAALHPSMTDLVAGHRVARTPGRLRLLILPCAVVALPVGGLVADILDIQFSVLDSLLVGFGTVVIGVLVAIRFFGLMKFVEHAADARARYRTEALVRESLDVVAIVGADFRIIYVSPPLERVLGWSATEAIGVRLDAIALPDEREMVNQYFERVIASDFGTPFMFTMNALSRGGEPLLMEVACVNRLDDPEINGIVVSARDISERTRLEQEVQYFALHDRLTRLANRSLLMDHIDLVLGARGEELGAIFLLDLDDFKAINDSLGHAAGDELLMSVGERLRTRVRPGDTLARLGGDEFALFFPTVGWADVGASAQRLLEVLALPLRAGSTELAISASIGVRVLKPDDSAQIALRDADIAMYSVKWAGKSSWKVFDAAMGEQAARRVSLIADLPGAWRRGEMHVHYQPIVEIPSGRLRGAEALLRWSHPVFGRVPPDEFIVLAEQSGVVRDLGLEVLQEASRNAASWRADGAPTFYISVNISPLQLDDALPDAVSGILAATGLDASALLLEITENVVLSNIDESRRVLDALHDRGIRIAIDDFGTGYSSLAYAQQFPIDLVKIDQSFTKKLDATHPGMVPTIIQLARTMGADVVAEGVETLEQMHELVRLGCRLAQGYLYCPGVPADSIADIVRDATLVPGGAYAAPTTPLTATR